MLKSVNRLKKDSDFQVVWRTGTKIKTAHLVGSFLVTNGEEPRFGVIISKKISKLAVKRNRVRRIILAQIAELLRLESKKNIDVVLRVASLPEGDVSRDIRQCVLECFAKLPSA